MLSSCNSILPGSEEIIPFLESLRRYLAKAKWVRYNHVAYSGCGAARSARAVRVGEVVGSNPTIPTAKTPREILRRFGLRYNGRNKSAERGIPRKKGVCWGRGPQHTPFFRE